MLVYLYVYGDNMDKFKSKIAKMGNRKIINIPKSIADYFEIGDKVEVKKIKKGEKENENNSNKTPG